MAKCNQCGRELPVYPDGRRVETCPECQVRERMQQQQVARAARPDTLQLAKMFPVTSAIIAINSVIYVACVLASLKSGRGSAFDFDQQLLLKWGADYGPLTLDRQFWRVLTSMFLHGGFLHVAANMWCLWNFGLIAERVYGRYRYLWIYLLTGLASSVASLAIHPGTLSVGASGAIFGVVGALVFPFYRKRVTLPPPVMKAMLRSLAVFIFVNLAIGQAIPFIDNAAHVGGLLAGLALGAIVTQAASSREELDRVFWKIANGSVLVLALAFVSVQHWRNDAILSGRAMLAAEAGNPKLATELANRAVEKDPRSGEAQYVKGLVLADQKKYPAAVAALREAVRLEPKNAEYQKALAYAEAQTAK